MNVLSHMLKICHVKEMIGFKGAEGKLVFMVMLMCCVQLCVS